MDQRLRIVHCFRAPVGGLFRHVLDLAGAQAERGHEVGLIADANAHDSLTEDRLAAAAPRLALGITRIAMPRRPGLGDLSAKAEVQRTALRLRADVLHGHGAKGGAYARLAGRGLKAQGVPVRVFYTPHGGTLHFSPWSVEGLIYLTLEKLLDRLTDGLILESGYAARIFDARVGGRAPRLIVPNGLAPDDFALQHPNKDAADFLFIGELRRLKGVDVMLRALRRVHDVRPVSAVIVGAGPDGDEFKALAHELGLAQCVNFPGAMPARRALPLGRSLVVPSRAESFPYVVLEAAAAAMPLIATRVGGIPEIVAGREGWLIEPGCVTALSEAMVMHLERRDEMRAHAVVLREQVSARFTVAGMTSAILDFYDNATARKPFANLDSKALGEPLTPA